MVKTFLFALLTYGSVLHGQILPPARCIDWDPGVLAPWPAPKDSVNVMAFGARGDSITDDSDAFQAAIESLAPRGGKVHIPSGKYLLRRRLYIGTPVTLRGEGHRNTRLIFDLDGRAENAVEITGSESGPWIPLVSGFSRGSRRLTPASGVLPAAGDLIELVQDNDPVRLYTSDAWNQEWAADAVGQIVDVTGSDDQGIRLGTPLYLEYESRLHPRIRKLNPVIHAGIENLCLFRGDSGTGDMILLKNAAFCRVSGLESAYTTGIHVFLFAAYRCDIVSCWFHHAHDYGEGGHGYGVDCAVHSSDNRIEDNVFEFLRHAMVVQVGACGNVFGYNYSFNPVSEGGPLPDLVLHGHFPNFNLFEGNTVQRIGIGDFWGPAGPGNTFLRNLVEIGGVDLEDASHHQNLIGNTLPAGPGSNSIRIHTSVHETLVHGNRLGSVIQWDPTIPERTVPDSYYLQAQPLFFNKTPWPLFGPNAIPTEALPATQRTRDGHPVAETRVSPAPATRFLLELFPNPNRGRFTVRIFIPDACFATLSLCDILGRTVRIFRSGFFERGLRTVVLDASDPAPATSGIYFLIFQSNARRFARKCVVL